MKPVSEQEWVADQTDGSIRRDGRNIIVVLEEAEERQLSVAIAALPKALAMLKELKTELESINPEFNNPRLNAILSDAGEAP